jgi:uncharacterized protein YkwD
MSIIGQGHEMRALQAPRNRRTTAATLAGVVSAALLVTVAVPGPALAKGHAANPHVTKGHAAKPRKESAEHALIHWVNVQRQHAGRAALVPAADLTVVAHHHAAHMARLRRPYHDPYLGSEVHHWLSLGEDVGSAASLASLEKALLATQDNRRNLLGPGLRHIGVGVTTRDGLLYVTVVTREPDRPQRH